MKNAYCDDGGVQLEGFQIVERPLLKDIVERFLAKTSGALGDKPKLYAYSAHDTTLAAVLSTLGIYPTEFPKYASAVLLELHGVGGQFVIWAPSPNQISLIGRCFDLWEQFRVLVVGYEYGYAQSLLIVFQNRLVSYKIYHKNMTDVDDVYRYVIPDCPDPCTLDALRSTVQKYLPTDWTEECGLSGPNAINYMISTVVFALTTALLAGFIALDVALKRRRHSFATDPLMIDDDDV
ncbi:hypothetical protein RB195_010248 [Necator americanus]|uniref:Histidine acid phosphatase n=1 Tax=Necator americanus TaxID=51031 RepID=A0ABR1CYY5_NECAM